MPAVSTSSIAAAVLKRLDSGEPRERVVRELAAYLVATRQTGRLSQILNELVLQLQRTHDQTYVEVTSAHELSGAVKREIEHIFTAVTGTSRAELHTQLDPSLLGGFIAKTPEMEIDLSVRTKLERLKTL